MSRDFVWGVFASYVTTLQSLGSISLVKVEIQRLLFVTWLHYRSVRWLCGWSPLILSNYPAKFGVHRPYENGDITSFICHVATMSKCHVTIWVGSSHPKSSPWVHKPYGTRNKGVCNINSNSNSISNSNSNAEVPMQRFTNIRGRTISWLN